MSESFPKIQACVPTKQSKALLETPLETVVPLNRHGVLGVKEVRNSVQESILRTSNA